VDTGFEGELALPSDLLRRLDATYAGDRPVVLADGSLTRRPCFGVAAEWDEETRVIEVIELEGKPLLGVELMEESLLQVEMTTGGQVSIEPL